MKKRNTYRYAIHDPKPDPKDTCNYKEINKALEDAFSMFNKTGAKWSPVGGLEATLNFGQAIRNHTDIDIEVDISELPKLKEGMDFYGYKLYEKLFSFKLINLPGFKKIMEIYRDCEIDDTILEKQVRLVHNAQNKNLIYNQNNKFHRLLNVIDVKICKQTSEGTLINNDGYFINITSPYNGQTMKFQGQPIQLRNRAYSNTIKAIESKQNQKKTNITLFDHFILTAEKEIYTEEDYKINPAELHPVTATKYYRSLLQGSNHKKTTTD
jgi:hypothetical protein